MVTTQPRILGMGVAFLATLEIAACLFAAAQRITYPYELEWLEGTGLDQTERLVDGKSLYQPPSAEFVPFIYPPFYYWVSAELARITGVSFLPLRIVSFASALGIAVIVACFALRETHDRGAGLVAAGLFMASYPLVDGWFDLARVDELCLFLTLSAALVMRFSTRNSSYAVAGVLFVASVFTKQTAAVIAAPLAVWAIAFRPRAALWLILTGGGLAALTFLAIDYASSGWFHYYVMVVPGAHGWYLQRLATFWVHDVMPRFALPALLTALLIWRWLSEPGRAREASERVWFYIALLSGSLAAALVSRLHVGGWVNVLMPAYAALAIGAGIAYGTVRRLQTGDATIRLRLTTTIQAALVAAFLVLYYNPLHLIPTRGDAIAGRELLDSIRSADGRVLVAEHGGYAQMAGKSCTAQTEAVRAVYTGDPSGGRRLLDRISARIRSRGYALIILDNSSTYDDVAPGKNWLRNAMAGTYQLTDSFDFGLHSFWPESGAQTRPRYLYRPIPKGAGDGR